MSILAGAKRHGIDPWAYLTHVLSELPARSAGADLPNLPPEAWANARGGARH